MIISFSSLLKLQLVPGIKIQSGTSWSLSKDENEIIIHMKLDSSSYEAI